jgi:hypothetical protein
MDTQTAINSRVTGIFHTITDADNVYYFLQRKGYTHDEITIVMTDKTHKGHFATHADKEEESHALDDAGRGALLGGTTGAIITVLAAIGSNLALPGFGLVMMGPLLAGLTGAAAGGLAGGTIGALIGSGYPKEHAEYYETSIQEGSVMISVSPKNALEKEEIIEEFKKCNGQSIYADDHVIV